jgi:hypothetical protein
MPSIGSLARAPRVMLAERIGRQKELRFFAALRELCGVETCSRPIPPERHALPSGAAKLRQQQIRRHKPRGEHDANSDLGHRFSLSVRFPV